MKSQDDDCRALLEWLGHGDPIPEPQLPSHLDTCERCRAVLAAAQSIEQHLRRDVRNDQPPLDPLLPRLQHEVDATRVRRIRLAVTGALAAAVALFLGLIFWSRGPLAPTEAAIVSALAFVGLMLPIAAIFVLRDVLRSRDGTPVFKRLRDGRQLSGVALGLAESMNVSVVAVRLIFVVLFFFKGLGLLLYVLFDLALPVHPDDREHQLRTRMWRALKRARM